jgi:hypothetical protein
MWSNVISLEIDKGKNYRKLNKIERRDRSMSENYISPISALEDSIKKTTVGRRTAEGGEIFNDYRTNKARANNAVAMGKNNQTNAENTFVAGSNNII